MSRAGRRTLTADDWAAAALRALAEGGTRAVAVEPLAARLGATKGSFYWHFRSRDELLAAALDRWERVETEEVIRTVEAEPDPLARLRALLLLVLGATTERAGNAVELGLQGDAGHPLVAPVLERVSRRRIAYLTALFTRLGFAAAEAERRSLLAYTAYLGHAQLAHATPTLAPRGEALQAYADEVIRTVVDRGGGDDRPAE
ncbi:TetR/AcrR family transcriptional regulator [Pseudonocardia halophobica]|uniref:TetR/AcrR family transcriptional regulator n=1 Tax=Pseudonocardia halophobica TaxID=29401 RepID=UPI003D949E27